MQVSGAIEEEKKGAGEDVRLRWDDIDRRNVGWILEQLNGDTSKEPSAVHRAEQNADLAKMVDSLVFAEDKIPTAELRLAEIQEPRGEIFVLE